MKPRPLAVVADPSSRRRFVASSLRRLLIACLSVAWLLLPSPAPAVTPASLLGPDLKPHRVRIRTLRDGRLSYFDEQRDLRDAPLSQFIQIRDLPGARAAKAEAADGARVDLADGQRLAGAWLGATADGQGLRWDHPSLGTVTIQLQDVRTLRLGPSGDQSAPTDFDHLWLANDDRLSGVLLALRDDAIVWQTSDAAAGAEPLVLPRANVRGFALASAGTIGSAAMRQVWLVDGSRVGVTDLSIARETLSMRPVLTVAAPDGAATAEDGIVRVPLAAVVRVELGSTATRLVDLTDVPLVHVSGGDVFGVPMPPRIEAGSIWLHAPVAVAFDLPAGAERLALVAQLAVDTAGASAWADLELVLSIDGRSLGRHRLSGRAPRAVVNVPVSSGRLTIEVDPAVNGPVLDRLWLREAVLMLGGPE